MLFSWIKKLNMLGDEREKQAISDNVLIPSKKETCFKGLDWENFLCDDLINPGNYFPGRY